MKYGAWFLAIGKLWFIGEIKNEITSKYYRAECDIRYSFAKDLSNGYYVPGNVLGARATVVNKKKLLSS